VVGAGDSLHIAAAGARGVGNERDRGRDESLVANDGNPLAHGQGRKEVLDAADDERGRCTALHRRIGVAVNIMTPPIQSQRRRCRPRNEVLERLAAVDHRVDHLVLTTGRRDQSAMIMDVHRLRRADETAALLFVVDTVSTTAPLAGTLFVAQIDG
jgi:hypothetical protein